MGGKTITAVIGCVLLLGTTASADEAAVSVQAGQWQCGTPKNSSPKSGYQCDVITFSPGFGGNPRVYLSLGKLDLSGPVVLESFSLNVAQVSWSGFQPAVEAKGWTDSTRSKEIDAHQMGNWGGTWIAIGPPLSEKH